MNKKIVYGNIYDKYHSKNPIVKYLMSRFFSNFNTILQGISVNKVLEIGCGEGEIGYRIKEIFPNAEYLGTDISEEILKEAKKRFSNLNFKILSIYDIHKENISVDLLIVSEVLEHLEDPLKAMESLMKADFKYLLLSVPREPVWRILNCLRFKYLNRFGDTPGHINHWSKRGFIKFLNQFQSQIYINKILNPLPWTLVLCKKINKV